MDRPRRLFTRSPIFQVRLPAPDPATGTENLFSFLFGLAEDDTRGDANALIAQTEPA